jgi:hypothetical protein
MHSRLANGGILAPNVWTRSYRGRMWVAGRHMPSMQM